MRSHLGLVSLYPSDQLPKGWLPCDGRALDVNKYPMLSSTIKGWGIMPTFSVPKIAPLNGVDYMIYVSENDFMLSTSYAGRIELMCIPSQNIDTNWVPTNGGTYMPGELGYGVLGTRYFGQNPPYYCGTPKIANRDNVPYYISISGAVANGNVSEDEDFVGKISLFLTGAILPGWIQCDGRSFYPQQFPELSTLLGSKYNNHVPKLDFPDPTCEYWIFAGLDF